MGQLDAQGRDHSGVQGESLTDFAGLDLGTRDLHGGGSQGDLVGCRVVEGTVERQGQVADASATVVDQVGVVDLCSGVSQRGGSTEELGGRDGRSICHRDRLGRNVGGFCVKAHLDDGAHIRLRVLPRHGHRQRGAVLGEVEGAVGAVHAHAGDMPADSGQGQRLAWAPQLGEEVQVVARGHDLAPVGGGVPGRARSRDGVRVACHPLSDIGDDVGVERVDRAVTLGTDVVGELSARGDRSDEVVDELAFLVALRVIVAVGPRAVSPAGGEDRADRLPGTHVEVRRHRVVAADLEVTGLVPHARVDHRLGLEFVDPLGHALGLLGRGATHVEPEFGDGAVVGEQLGELGLDDGRHQLFVNGVDVAVGFGCLLRPVDDREVEGELDSELVALSRQLLHGILAVVGLLDDVVVGRGRVPHGEAVVMLGRDHQVGHARVVDRLADGRGVEVGGQVLGLGQVVVGGDVLPGLDLLGVAHPLAMAVVVSAVDGVDAKVHEHAVLEALPVGDFRGDAEGDRCWDAGGLRWRVGVCGGAQGCEHQRRGRRATDKRSLEVHGVSFQGGVWTAVSVLVDEDEAYVTPCKLSMNQFDSSFPTNQGFP